MSFAEKILQKYGWKEGEGLGKNSDGISKPLKAHLKFDNVGLGVDRADEFNNHWWERVFNEAAKNVEIKEDGDKISVNTKNDESVEITTKEYSVRKLKNKKIDAYDNFLSSSTLVNTGSEVANPFKIDVDDIKVTAHKPLTDEELFAACGGRTAHKGARHGLKLSGKLARIEQQEKEMLLKMQTNPIEKIPDTWTVVKTKKKKNKKKPEEELPVPDQGEEEDSKLNSILYTTEYCIKSKKKRKEKKQTEEELSNSLESFSLQKDKDETIVALNENSKAIKKLKKEKKSKKNKNKLNNESYPSNKLIEAFEIDEDEVDSIATGNPEETVESVDVPLKKKNKKCKHGIDKDAKEAHKKAKKTKKNLRHITEDLQRSILIEA